MHSVPPSPRETQAPTTCHRSQSVATDDDQKENARWLAGDILGIAANWQNEKDLQPRPATWGSCSNRWAHIHLASMRWSLQILQPSRRNRIVGSSCQGASYSSVITNACSYSQSPWRFGTSASPHSRRADGCRKARRLKGQLRAVRQLSSNHLRSRELRNRSTSLLLLNSASCRSLQISSGSLAHEHLCFPKFWMVYYKCDIALDNSMSMLRFRTSTGHQVKAKDEKVSAALMNNGSEDRSVDDFVPEIPSEKETLPIPQLLIILRSDGRVHVEQSFWDTKSVVDEYMCFFISLIAIRTRM